VTDVGDFAGFWLRHQRIGTRLRLICPRGRKQRAIDADLMCNRDGPTCIGPSDLFLLLAFVVSLLAVLLGVLRVLLGVG
jgi:hypothetical protein